MITGFTFRPSHGLQLRIRRAQRPLLLCLLPLVMGLAYLAGGQTGVYGAALAFPLALMFGVNSVDPSKLPRPDPLTGLAERDRLIDALDAALRVRGQTTAALVLEIDRFKLLEESHERAVVERVLCATADRLRDVLRDTDVAARLDGATFAIALTSVHRLDLEATLQLSARIQQSVAAPIAIDGENVYVSVSVGFSLAQRIKAPCGTTLLQAATSAMIEAQRSGPCAIRSYSGAMKNRIKTRNSLCDEVADALECGDIRAFFQPQISLKTGEVSGFETLARWLHPQRGLIPPVEFLPALRQAGLMERLGEVMTRDALTALRTWDENGHKIPRVGVNFSTAELRSPHLVDHVTWNLDRFDLTPDRLVIEVLETVVAGQSEDFVIRNLSGLARLGCCLDLDDFGTGHASITNIRRFSIERIKIDRSFVTNIDQDGEQQQMVAAILTMADRLGLDTLAEGVETLAEQKMLERLGCGHAQGFGIARPMPFEETCQWITEFTTDVPRLITLPGRAGISAPELAKTGKTA